MMKGKDKFTSAEILELRELIAERQNASRNYQKQLRNRMRKIGFFGRDDWGIIDCTLETLSKILCKWKQDSAVSLFLYLDSVFKNKHKLIHNQAPVMNRLCPFLLNLHK